VVTVTEQRADLWELSDLATPWCVRVAATLRIADHIAAGISSADDLAVAAECDRNSLVRVLRQLISKGVFTEPSPAEFALNEAARGLLDDGLKIGFGLEGFGGRMAGAWGGLLAAVRSGGPAYREVFGRPFWEDLDAHPEIAAQFDAMMGPAGHGPASPDILISGGWETVRQVVDVGGGTGSLLAAVLREHPHVEGILVDLPRTVARAEEIFAAAGVADRVSATGQSFFDPLPAGADVYVLKSVLPDWPDAEAMAILRNCAQAGGAGSRVVVASGVSPDETAGEGDLLMMVLVGGKVRSLEEFGRLAEAAGLKTLASGKNAAGRFIVECTPLA
jgi:hypothetical protein